MNGRHVSLEERTRIIRPCRLRGTRRLYIGGRTRAPQASRLLRPSRKPIQAPLRLRPRRWFHRTRMEACSLARPTRPCTAREGSIASLSSAGPFIAIERLTTPLPNQSRTRTPKPQRRQLRRHWRARRTRSRRRWHHRRPTGALLLRKRLPRGVVRRPGDAAAVPSLIMSGGLAITSSRR